MHHNVWVRHNEKNVFGMSLETPAKGKCCEPIISLFKNKIDGLIYLLSHKCKIMWVAHYSILSFVYVLINYKI